MEEAVRSGYGALGAAIELEHKRAAARMRKPRKRLQRAARSLAERLPQRLPPLRWWAADAKRAGRARAATSSIPTVAAASASLRSDCLSERGATA